MAPICFFFSFRGTAPWTKGRAEMISFIGFSPTGTRRTHGHLERSFVSTWEPSALCSFAGPILKEKGAIKPAASFKHSGRPLDVDYIKVHLDTSAKSNQRFAQKITTKETWHYLCASFLLLFFYLVFAPGLQQKDKTPAHCCLHTLQSLQVTSRWRHCSTTSPQLLLTLLSNEPALCNIL